VAEKEPRGQKSVEVLTRAALARIDANRPAPVDAPIGPGLNDTHARVDGIRPRQASVPPRQAEVGPRPVDVPPSPAAINAAQPAVDAQPQPVQPRPAAGTNLQPGSPEGRASVNPQPSSAAPQPAPADQDNDLFSALKGIPDLLRPEPPTATAKPRVRPCRSGKRHLKGNSEIESRSAKVPVGRQKPGDICAQLLSISGCTTFLFATDMCWALRVCPRLPSVKRVSVPVEWNPWALSAVSVQSGPERAFRQPLRRTPAP
jgi:hypothetical protein